MSGGGSGYIDVDNRHQTSLSTFDTTGKLLQVEYAMEAANLGTPIIAVVVNSKGKQQQQQIVLASPQVLPTPFAIDDGTTRFVRVTNTIMVGHSGLSADGRMLLASCQQLAIQHEYQYDESIPIDLFLEEMSLLYQDHTMKAGVRPFGSTLLVAALPNQADDDNEACSCLYRIDPSGSVQNCGNYAIINGDKMQSDTTLLQQLENIADQQQSSATTTPTPQELGEKVVTALEDALRRSVSAVAAATEGRSTTTTTDLPSNVRRILTASLSREEGMVMDRYDLPRL